LGFVSRKPTKEVRLLIAISTLGKRGRFQETLDSLKQQTDQNFRLIICDQSENCNIADLFDFRGLELKLEIVPTMMRGASLGRNLLWSSSPEDTSHVIFPNDTSIFDRDFVKEIKRTTGETEIHVLSYEQNGKPRYVFAQGSDPINHSNVWLVLESATVFSMELLRKVGGFDEKIGTGSSTPYQSGEGTDLLLRSLVIQPRCRWSPDISVHGVPEDYSLTKSAYRKKVRSYGWGYGHLLSKHRFSLRKKITSLVGPFIRAIQFKLDFRVAVQIAAGRFLGIVSTRPLPKDRSRK
jgi:hypothetical protein